MTNRERVLAAINHERPDYTPHNIYFTAQMLRKMIDHTGDPDYINSIGNNIDKVKLRKSLVPVEGKTEHFTDEFGIEWDLSGVDKDIGVVAEYPVNSAEELAEYEPPEVDEAYVRGECERLMKNGKENFKLASVGFALFERAWSLCGMEDLMCYMLTDPEAVESLFKKLTENNMRKTEIALEYDFDGVIFGDDWGQQKGLIMGAPLWRKFIRPCAAALYGAVKKKGKYVAQHSCGDNSEIFGDLIDIGLDVYQTFQPEIYNLRSYKQKFSGKLTIWGGISTQTQLPFLTPEKIYETVTQTISILGEGGGYIAAPTHDAPGDIPPRNIEAMVRAFKDQAKK